MLDSDRSPKRLKMDPQEVERRLAYFEITPSDLERLAAHRPFAEAHMDEVVERFYDLILKHPETAAYMDDPERMRRLKRLQRSYFLGLFDGVIDTDYVHDRLRVGSTHERVGLPFKWYMGSYSRYLLILLDLLQQNYEPVEAHEIYRSLQKVVFFDSTLAIDAYMLAQLDTLSRHQAAIRELSTPVILVHDGVLLLPLVGTIDSLRAQQIMETVLTRITDQQARVLILDIAGVPVVDTQVADYLLKATAAVRLLGARTILTGISPQVARTMVELGVDISAMETRNKLSDGIELALRIVGRHIVRSDVS
ncbi:MAG: STAS domain-containing protein [Deltaproteobacteria bacterium]|nr:MAG: STAS domain-containing protein [Deltaproteobacteria bacterium]